MARREEGHVNDAPRGAGDNDGWDRSTGGSGATDLQFDRVEAFDGQAASSGVTCTLCQNAIQDEYFEINGKITCAACRALVETDLTRPPGPRTYFRATLWGTGAAAIGSLIYFAVARLTGYELGLIAIVVGLLVGGAVRRASGGRGGWKLQAIAMALTYAAIVTTYVPAVYQGLTSTLDKGPEATSELAPAATSAPAPDAAPTPEAAAPEAAPASSLGALLLFGAILFFLAAIAPFLSGFENFMGWLIIGIALYEAWKLNRRVELQISGPYRVGSGGTGGDSSPMT